MRTKLGGFSTKILRQHLDTIDNDPAYSYYADIIRAYLSMSAEEVAKYQIRMSVASNKSANLQTIKRLATDTEKIVQEVASKRLE